MHLIAHGIGKHIYELVMVDITSNNKFYYTNQSGATVSANYPFYICKDRLDDIGKSIFQSRQFIPTSFQGSFDNVVLKTEGTRAVDWLDSLLYVVPTIVVPSLQSEECRKAVLALVRGCAIALQWELTNELIDEMEK